tara:strand:+ start:746 stop:949 length:204 start_codon:yes stop_codon:yes gene_type:complete
MNNIEKLIELYEMAYNENDHLIMANLIHTIITDIVEDESTTVEQSRLIFDRTSKIRRQSLRKLKTTI